MMKQSKIKATLFAFLAAALYAVSAPVSKLLLAQIPATMMAGFLYLGAGLGMLLLYLFKKLFHFETNEKSLTKAELPYTIMMILLDILAPVSLLFGLSMTTAANASLLNNFEIVATSLIALFIFKEAIPKRLWIAILLVTASSILLTFQSEDSFSFSFGSFFILLACVFWGFENNCTRKMSDKSPMQIVILKGIFSGLGSLLIALLIGERYASFRYILLTLLLGFVAYGLSIYFYVYAQRDLGAAKTSTYYAVSPFIGVLLSFILFGNLPSVSFVIALILMAVGTYFASTDHKKRHT